MDKTLQDAIASLMSKAVDGVDASVAFLSAELPDYIIQMLTWYGAKSFILWVAAIVFVTVYIRLVRGIEGYAITSTSPIPRDFGVVLGGALCFFAGLSVILNLTWLKIWIAPKVWLVEYAANLAAKGACP